MSPVAARLAALLFVMLVGAISVNALYWQSPQIPPQAAAEARGQDRRAEPETAQPTPEAQAQRSADAENSTAPAPPQPASKSGTADPKEDADKSQPQAAVPVTENKQDLQTSALSPSETKPVSADTGGVSIRITPRMVSVMQRELAARGYDVHRRDGKVDLATRIAILAYEFDSGLSLTGTPSQPLLKSLLFGPFNPAPTGEQAPQRFGANQQIVHEVQNVLAQLGYSAEAPNGVVSAHTREAIRRFEHDRAMSAEGRLSSRLLLELVIVTGKPIARDAEAGRKQQAGGNRD